MHRIPFVLVALTSITSLARAEDNKFTLDGPCRQYIESTAYYKHTPTSGTDDRFTVANCEALIPRVKAANISNEHLTDTITFGDMPAVCKEFAAWHRVAEAAKVLWDADQTNYWLTAIDVAENHEENQAMLVDEAAKCSSTIDRLVAEGLQTDVEIETKMAGKLKISEGKDKICAPLEKAAKVFAKGVTKAREAKLAALAAPYKKIGVTGDRLQVCMDWDGIDLRGVGGGELSTPMQRKKASVMFATLGPASDTGLYTIRRFAFKGDKLLSVTERQFLLLPGAAGYR